MDLPIEFKNRMQSLLGEEYVSFLACFALPHRRGIRLNPLKCDLETLRAALPFVPEQAPFSPLSYYAPAGVKMAALPLYHAGAFYAQEPSASSAVTLLDPQPGERILDLCAAPGGKSTQIAALTKDRGLLWSNEVVRSRAAVLASNLERMGVKNAVISNAYPEVLAEKLAGYFDRVLVDAPCSGEGMFRRDDTAVSEWSEAHVKACAARQRAVLNSAARCLREGGVLVYSTCTFSVEENEGAVRQFLKDNPEFELEVPRVSFGRAACGLPAVRIYPMDGGEGHFAARFRRMAKNHNAAAAFIPTADKAVQENAQALYSALFKDEPGRFMRIADRVLLLPGDLPALSGIPILRAGVEFGILKKNRMEPVHGIFMAQCPENCRQELSLSHDSSVVYAFLRGEEIEAQNARGYTAVSVDGVVCGFGKASNGILKNKYPKGLRMLK